MTVRGRHPRRGSIRLLAVLVGAWGLALVARPRRVADALCPELPDSRLWVARVLGARVMVQQAVVLVRPDPGTVRAAVAVDLLHAASMVPLLISPRYRRPALVSGGPATAYAALASAVLPRSERG